MGPVEFIVLAFPEEELRVGVVDTLADLRREGSLRVMDSLVVTKAGDGSVTSSELHEYEELKAVLGPGYEDEATLIGPEDAQEAAGLLGKGNCALLLLVEHVWAQRAAESVREAGGRIAASVRIPPEHVDEAATAYLRAVADAAAGNGS
ncbi:hypothetical protein GTY65_33055 [Streptomyces sp. SID8379]|uniref:DUF6325 family protein n=1 Tax=unclassified Streptomyces TaxID=2593676 RepID=UPI0003622353|nr:MULTISPECIES: DUF6325 family protein [unclassified Streptomyces]MYW68869.1 hypothetical protein [Streptomyces sp. SID8379]